MIQMLRLVIELAFSKNFQEVIFFLNDFEEAE